MEESSGRYPLVNVNRGIIQGSSETGTHHESSGEIGAPSEGVDFDPRNLIPVPIVFCDDEGQIVWVNSAAEDLTGFSSRHLVGKTFTELFPEEKRTGIARRVMRWRRRGETKLYLEEPIQTATLQPHWIGVTVKRVPAPAGKEVYVCSLHDLQAMRDELESLRRQVSELEARIDEAASSVQLKSEFIRTISEDIRAPMSGVVGMSRFLLETDLNPEQLTFAEVIENSGQQLLDVVDDLLDFSRIEAGELEIQSIEFDVRVAVEAVAVTLGTRATDRQLGFVFGVDKSVQSKLVGDPARFRQILLNLGKTVIEETQSGEVSLRVRLAEERARGLTLQVAIETTDPQSRHKSDENVFEVFASGDSSDLRKLGSRGLGFNLCRQILSLMRGEIIDSAVGSTGLSFSVPFQKQMLPEITAVAEEITLEGVHVVVADPLGDNSIWLAETLTGWGCTVTETPSGDEIVEALSSMAASGVARRVVLIDLDCPGISMEHLASAIRGDTSISDTPLMMITGMGRPGDADMATGLGFRAYLTKPIEPVDLRESVIEVLRTQRGDRSTAPLVTRHLLAERRRSEQLIESAAAMESVASAEQPASAAAADWVDPAESETLVETVAPEEPVVAEEPEWPVETVAPEEPVVAEDPEWPVETVAPEEPVVAEDPEWPVADFALVEPAAVEEPETPVEAVTPVEPAAVEEPETPVEAATPVEPAVVEEPETPVEAATPVEPAVVEEPETPVEAVAPVEPAVVEEPETPVEAVAPVEPAVVEEPETPVEAVAPVEPAVVEEPETPVEAVAPVEPAVVEEPVSPARPERDSELLRDALRAKNEALLDLTQVLGLQATLAKGRLRKAVEIGNRREIEWEARSLDKMYGATGASELSKEFRELASLAGSGEISEIQAKWDAVEKRFEEGSPPLGMTRRAA